MWKFPVDPLKNNIVDGCSVRFSPERVKTRSEAHFIKPINRENWCYHVTQAEKEHYTKLLNVVPTQSTLIDTLNS